MDIYKRIAVVENEEEAMEMLDELIDRFGDVPRSVQNLLEVAQLRYAAHTLYIKEIKGDKAVVRFYMHPKAKVKAEVIPAMIRQYNGGLRFVQGDQPYFMIAAGKGKIKEKELTIQSVKMLLNDIKLLLV